MGAGGECSNQGPPLTKMNYYTTWNAMMVAVPHLRHNYARGLVASSVVVSGAGAVMFVDTLARKRGANVLWKGRQVSWAAYLALEAFFHQLPLAISLAQKPSGSADWALVPAFTYAILCTNPYYILRYKLRNWHGVALVGLSVACVDLAWRVSEK